jgi:hypothetical protein
MNRRLASLCGALPLIFLAAAAPRASACSICRCGDSTFNALGSAVYTPGRFRLTVDWDRFDKESGVSEIGAMDITGHDAEVENRFTLGVAYSFGERLTLVARLPFSMRHLTETGEEGAIVTRTNGLSDPDFTALYRVWASPFRPGMGQQAWISLVAGVKTPWGRNELSEDGVRLDEHAQSGTGATDFYGGFSAVVQLDTQSSLFASFQYRHTGTNDHDYRYGRTTSANLAYEHKLGGTVDAVIEANFRHAEQDRIDADGNRDPNTGGDLVYLTPRLVLDLGGGLVGRVGVQIPVVKNLYGDQAERANVNVGLTVLF